MFEFMIADFLEGFSYYTAHFWSSIGTATDFCQGIFETTYSPAQKQLLQDHVTSIQGFSEGIVEYVHGKMAFNHSVDISNPDIRLMG